MKTNVQKKTSQKSSEVQAQALFLWLENYIQEKTGLKKNLEFVILGDKAKEIDDCNSHHMQIVIMVKIHPRYKNDLHKINLQIANVRQDYDNHQKLHGEQSENLHPLFFHMNVQIEPGEFKKRFPAKAPVVSPPMSPPLTVETIDLHLQYKNFMTQAHEFYKDDTQRIEHVAEQKYKELLEESDTLEQIASLIKAVREDIQNKHIIFLPAREKAKVIIGNLLSSPDPVRLNFIHSWSSKWNQHSLFSEHRKEHFWQGAFGNTATQNSVNRMIKAHSGNNSRL